MPTSKNRIRFHTALNFMKSPSRFDLRTAINCVSGFGVKAKKEKKRNSSSFAYNASFAFRRCFFLQLNQISFGLDQFSMKKRIRAKSSSPLGSAFVGWFVFGSFLFRTEID